MPSVPTNLKHPEIYSTSILITWNRVFNIDYYLINTGTQSDNRLSCSDGERVDENRVCLYTMY